MGREREGVGEVHQEAQSRFEAREFAQAAEAFEQVLQQDPENVDAQVGYARSLFEIQEYDRGLAFLEPKRAETADGRLLAELGRIYYAQHRFDEAASVLKEAAERRPEDGHIKANYGFALWENGDQQAALRVLQEAVPLVEDDVFLAANMGQIFMALGMWNEAVASLDRYLVDHPDDLDRRVMLAFALKEAGWREEAATALEGILTIDPNMEQARNLLEAIRTEAESTTEQPAQESEMAVVGGERAADAPSEGAPELPPLEGLDKVDVELTMPEEGPDSDADAATAAQTFETIQAEVAERLTNEDLDGAIERVASARDEGEASADLLNLLGKLYIEKEQYETALETFRDAVEEDPFHPQAHSNLGVLLWQLGEFDEAIKVLTRAVELDNEDMDARINLALICHQVGFCDEAVPLYTGYLDGFPEDTDMRMELAECYVELGEIEAALAELDTVLLLDPENERAQKRHEELAKENAK